MRAELRSARGALVDRVRSTTSTALLLDERFQPAYGCVPLLRNLIEVLVRQSKPPSLQLPNLLASLTMAAD